MFQRFSCVLLLLTLFSITGHAQRFCATTAYDSVLQQRYPDWQLSRKALEVMLIQRPSGHLRTEEEVVRIPIVVHVVHHEKNSNPGVGGNISDEQIRSQITVLNEDYRRKAGTNGFNTSSVGADTEIEFFLATCDPDGKSSTGILRIYNEQTDFDAYSEDDVRLKALSYWPSDQYLNIWVTDVKSPYIGYTQFPDMSGLPGLSPSNGPASTDGVVIDYKVFGKQGSITSKLYNLGRTTTHEIGHWLGLLHTWGDVECTGGQCSCGDDHCSDTPPASAPNDDDTGNTCTPLFSNCNGVQTTNMIENYLDYSPDKCMNIFTKDQKARMRGVLKTSPRRIALVQNSVKCLSLPSAEQLTVKVYPNPGKKTESTLVEVLLKDTQAVTLQLYDVLGRLLLIKEYTSTSSTVLSFPNGSLSVGMYFVVVTTTGGEKAVKRLVIN